jgi:hypothetical protein
MGAMRRRRLVLALVFLALLAGIAGLALIAAQRSARLRLAGQNREMERLVEESAVLTRAAETALDAEAFDLAAVAATPLVDGILQEFVGYEQLTRRGNRFRIERLATEFRPGHAVLRARADFDWRLGLYHGPIEVTYLAFARLSQGGECYLYFRVAELRTLAPWAILNRWLEPVLTLRMQRRLEIPDLRLPLGGPADPAGALAVERQVVGPAGGGVSSGGARVRVSVARPAWDLGGRRALVFVNPAQLGLVVERRAGRASPVPAAAAGPPAAVRLAVRLDFLADQLAGAVRGDRDLAIEVDRLPGVWRRRSRLLGVEFDNHLDLERLTGSLDVLDLELRPAAEGLSARLALAARLSGILQGELFGVAASVPFRAASRVEEVIPLRLEGTPAGLRLATDRETLVVPLELEAGILSQTVRFTYPLAIPWSELLAAVRVPDMLASSVAIPARVERGEVRARRTLPIQIDWRIELPAAADGLVRAWGEVAIGPPAATAAAAEGGGT